MPGLPQGLGQLLAFFLSTTAAVSERATASSIKAWDQEFTGKLTHTRVLLTLLVSHALANLVNKSRWISSIVVF